MAKKEFDITNIKKELDKYKLSQEEKKIIELINQIIEVRKEKKITQQQLADKCNIPRSTVARAEACITTPSLPILFKILSALDLKIKIERLDNI